MEEERGREWGISEGLCSVLAGANERRRNEFEEGACELRVARMDGCFFGESETARERERERLGARGRDGARRD